MVNTAGDTQIDKVEDAGKTAEQAAHQAQVIAEKFGDVDIAVTVATEQADRSENEADRAEKAVTDVITETEEQIKEIQAVGAEQVNAINSKSAEQVAIVTATGAEQSEMVVSTGAEQSQTLEVTGSQEKLEINQLADGRIDDINAVGADLDILVDRAETANTQANTAATEAKKAEANATAIVHNDEGSLTPKPGAYAVADSNGYLDIGWTPLLQAMYPYSGVIGSVNKDDTFTFQQNTTAVDRFYIKDKNAFNIFGRFVNISKDTRVQVPEAESTAARASAFDDIFLDWNGNIKTYRSIAPHRTVTGYDRDAIATEHGPAFTRSATPMRCFWAGSLGGIRAAIIRYTTPKGRARLLVRRVAVADGGMLGLISQLNPRIRNNVFILVERTVFRHTNRERLAAWAGS